MNNVSLVGNLCRDVAVTYSTGENATAMFNNSIAVQRKFKNKETGQYDSDFINVKAFGSVAEFIGKYFTKGSKIGITGEIRTGSYTNKEGVKVYTTDVVINNAEFVSKKDENPAANGTQTGGTTQTDNNFVNQGIDPNIENDLPF